MILRPISGTENPNGAIPVSLRCPACRRDVTFESIGYTDTVLLVEGLGRFRAGQRRCGNPECRAHLFVVINWGARRQAVVATYPPETIDFDSSDVPERVVASFEEAITCHAHRCYVAAAIMVRKTLEEICVDRGADGGNLRQKIEALGTTVVLPQTLLTGLDDLRLLGNDAAHLESRVYEQVGQEELEVAIDVAKEILKATYQYESLMGRLRALKKDRQAQQ